MSLEASIAELTLAVRALTDVLLNPVQPQVISTPVEMPQAVSVTVESKPSLADATLATAEIVGTEDLDSHNAPLTYDDVKKATIALSAKSKAEAVKLLADYGVKKATELPQDSWKAYVAEATILAA